MKVFVLTFLFCLGILDAKEFLYPVGYHPERNVVFVIYQKTSTHIELWEWDPCTKYAHQLLLSRYSPAGFTFLPDYSGFSFIDNGILKVKQLVKRSPRTIEYDAPIYNVEQVYWIDNKTCYASGKYQDYSGIFQIDWDGVVQPLLFNEGVDYQYPQKIDNSLFFIERTEKDYKIGLINYEVDPQDTFEAGLTTAKKRGSEILNFGKRPIVFLQMISEKEGYVLSHPEVVSRKSAVIQFDYYKITKSDNSWNSAPLFSFTIPTGFLMRGPERLFESILPLLPTIVNDTIYYVDSEGTALLSLWSLDVTGKKRITHKQHHFGIKKTDFGFVYGGEMGGSIEMSEGVCLELGLLFVS